jgi:purine-nucleoside phosphorylase
MSMRVFAISAVTDVAFPEEEVEVTLEMVIEAAKKAEPNLRLIFKEMIKRIGNE